MSVSSRSHAVGIDLGGTSIKAALVSADYRIVAHRHLPTEIRSQDSLLDELARLVVAVRGDAVIGGVGFGLPSQIDQRHGRVLESTNVPLENIDFVAEMHRRLDLPVTIDNDANVACLAEARVGAARGLSHVVMLTLGTGVGGGLLLDGRLYRGAIGSGGELGHMTIDEDGPPCQGNCPNRGCLEVLTSATGVLAAASRVAAERPHGSLASARALDARFVIDQAVAGDEDACAALAVVGRHLGVGIASYVNIFNPQMVVVGGGVMAAGELILAPARAEFERRVLRATALGVRVVAAELGNDAGVVGAAALVLE